MSLEEGVKQLIRYELSGHPGIQRAFLHGGDEVQTEGDIADLALFLASGVREAVVRVAREIDAMNSAAG